jgi:hypothetical protein
VTASPDGQRGPVAVGEELVACVGVAAFACEVVTGGVAGLSVQAESTTITGRASAATHRRTGLTWTAVWRAKPTGMRLILSPVRVEGDR